MFFTFWFQFFAAIIAAGLLYGAIYILMQDKAEKHIQHVAAERDTNLTTAELAAYDGRTSGRPILVSLCGKIYDVMSSAALYGKGGVERSTAAACGRLTSTDAALMSCTSSPSVTSKPSPAARAAASSTAVSAAAAAARRIGANCRCA